MIDMNERLLRADDGRFVHIIFVGIPYREQHLIIMITMWN